MTSQLFSLQGRSALVTGGASGIGQALAVALRADKARQQQILDRIPASRWGRTADIGGAAVFLASEAAAYVHGQVLAVDGGWLAR